MTKTVIKKIARTTGITRLAHHLYRRRPVILMYHGLTENPQTEDWTQVPLAEFTDQMEYLRRHYHPVSLTQLITMLDTGDIAAHSVVVTFDDGYKSNIELAWPVLKRLEIPAAIFITSGFVKRTLTGGMLWLDLVTALLRAYDGVTINLTDLGLGRFDIANRSEISEAGKALRNRLKSIPADRLENIIDSLATTFGSLASPETYPDYSPMTPEDLNRLSADNLITVGAHTRSHPILSRLEPEKLEDEIIGGKKDLEILIGRGIDFFAYPNGTRLDIGRAAFDIVARNYAAALTTEPGLTHLRSNHHLLPRIGIGRGLTIKMFADLISGAYYALRKPLTAV